MINTMAEANRSVPQIPTIHITTAAHCLAQLRARNAVKDQLRKQGLKASHYSARDITAMACEYLSEHRSELLPPSIETITRWTLAGEFGKRAQRALSAKLTTNARTQTEPYSMASAVQKLGG
jgi:hypothetical protein